MSETWVLGDVLRPTEYALKHLNEGLIGLRVLYLGRVARYDVTMAIRPPREYNSWRVGRVRAMSLARDCFEIDDRWPDE